jgi:ribosomal protein S18 acetylase RimI-like enzyme
MAVMPERAIARPRAHDAEREPSRTLAPMQVRALHDDERDWLRATLTELWHDDNVVGRGRVWMHGEQPALIAVDEAGERVGIATYAVEGETAELVTLNALRPGLGAGRRLVEAVAEAARTAGAARLRVMTTNDNTVALRLYQRVGFRFAEVRPGAVDEARRTLKPTIPLVGNDGIPIRDEIDLVLDLRSP